MGLRFQIFPARGLVYVNYWGTLFIDETARVFGEYAAHPDARPGQKQLVNLARVTNYERDYPKIFELQMRKAEVFVNQEAPALMVYYAPTDISLALAQMISRSWDGMEGVIARVVNTSESDALTVLGERETSFDALLLKAGQEA